MHWHFLLLLPILWSTTVECHGLKAPKHSLKMDNLPKVTGHSDKMSTKMVGGRNFTLLFEKYGKQILGTEHQGKWKFIEEISKKHCVLEAIFCPQNSAEYCSDENDELNFFKNAWSEINQNDPALSQLLEALFAAVLSANKALEYADDANKLSAQLNELKKSLAYAVFFMAKRGQIPLESRRREEKEREPKEILIALIDIYNEWQLDVDWVTKSCRKCGKKGKEENGQKQKYGQKQRRFLQFFAHSLQMKWDGNAFSGGGQQWDDDDANDQQCDDVCAICFDQFPLKTFDRPLPCNHIFHNDCIEDWFRSGHKTCPICRREMATQNVVPDQNNNGTANGPN
ncbi:hypothetical protein niasHT_014152 [Heterodera trifolii]|uniref:RING-type domain-containing protein n=1 Tax=Heterodera trifolii TaxID=157864 RepID=A0ABD2KWW0_9BILA